MRDVSAHPLLHVDRLAVNFQTPGGVVHAVSDASLTAEAGRTLCIVGESGCGKSVTALSLLRLIRPPGRLSAGSIRFAIGDDEVVDIASLSERDLRGIRGAQIAMIFQEPMSSLSPVHTVGSQIVEAIRLHTQHTARTARDEAIAALERVGIPDPAGRFSSYTFELSGGLRQRAMIAMALACTPRLLIADEPTTALDVTTQAAILDLLAALQQERGMGLIFITHDLGVVAEIADDVAVMYLGLVVERADVRSIFATPRHPYTAGLLRSIPGGELATKSELPAIPGSVPSGLRHPSGCPFHPRCDRAIPGVCEREVPPEQSAGDGGVFRCHNPLPAVAVVRGGANREQQ